MFMRYIAIFCLAAAAGSAQSTITLNGASYILKDHPRVFFDGPAGTLTGSVKDPDGAGSLVAPKAVSSNAPWQSLLNRSAFWNSTYPYNNPNNVTDYSGGQQAAEFAMRWYSDNSQTAYHDAALYMLTHIEQFYPMFCDEGQVDCIAAGGTGYYVGSYGLIYWNQQWIFAYELMRGEMTAQQRQDFVSKWANDLASFGGVTGSPGVGCTNPSANAPGTVSSSNGNLTSTAPIFGAGNPIQVGYWVAQNSSGGSATVAQIVSITDSTHAAVGSRIAGSWGTWTGTLGYRRNSWQDGDCGMMWLGKHGRFAPRSVTYVSGTTAYPPSGGTQMDYLSNNTFSPFAQMMAVYLSILDDDANSAVRSQAQLTTLYNDWYANIWSGYVEHGYTGFHYSGSAYGLSRPLDTTQVPAMFTWSINGAPPAIGDGVWAKNFLYHYFMNWVPSCPSAEPQWGQDFGLTNGFGDPNSMFHAAIPYALYHTTDEGKRFNWALRNRLSNCGSYGVTPGTALFWTAANLSGASANALDQWIYLYTDPAWPSSDLSASGPTAAALNESDAPAAAYPQSVLISRTGYSSIVDTLVNFYGLYERYGDHNWPAGGYYPGAYKIFKGNYLLAADGDQYTNPNSAYSTAYVSYHAGGSRSGYMEVGGAANLLRTGTPCGATMPRANTDGIANRFAYAMVDSTPCYKAGVIRAQRHLADFKGGPQQFIIVYDDVATAGGQTKRTYLHYPNNYGAAGITDAKRGTTTVSGNTITSTNPGTGHGDATQLLTTVLAPGANQALVYTDNPDGTYSGGGGKTFRVSVCASADGATCDGTNTLAEFLVVHEPAAGTGNTVPAVSLITTDGNWRGVQVGGAAPKVALFARQGTVYSRASFTSTHSGVAQILIAGLAPGTYVIRGPVSANATVGLDGTVYFEGAAGSYQIAPEFVNCGIRGKACIGGKAEIQ